jgi:hypothetical protein
MLYFPLVPDQAGQNPIVKEGKEINLFSPSAVQKMEHVVSRDPRRWMNRIEVVGHATLSLVESDGLKDLCGE